MNLARHAYPRSPSAARLRARLAETEKAISERRLKPGQLVMIDESSLAGTFTLDELVSAATTAGSKILLLGDHAQMSSVEAGGAFSLLVKDRGDLVPELTDVRRFSSEWEKAASVELRAGNTSAIDAYEAHDRVTSRRSGEPVGRHLRGLEGRRRGRQVEPHDRRGQRHRRRAEPAGEDSVAWPKEQSPSPALRSRTARGRASATRSSPARTTAC